MKSNTSAPNYHPECQLISRSQELRRLALIRGWEARGGHMSTNRGPRAKTHQCSCPYPAAPQLKGPGLWGSYNSTWPSHSTQDPEPARPGVL